MDSAEDSLILQRQTSPGSFWNMVFWNGENYGTGWLIRVKSLWAVEPEACQPARPPFFRYSKVALSLNKPCVGERQESEWNPRSSRKHLLSQAAVSRSSVRCQHQAPEWASVDVTVGLLIGLLTCSRYTYTHHKPGVKLAPGPWGEETTPGC